MRPLTPPAALMASTAKPTPRLKPIVGAELGPVIAAGKPILIGSDAAIAGFGNNDVAAPSAPALPTNNCRRETAICLSLRYCFSARGVSRTDRQPSKVYRQIPAAKGRV